MSAPLGNQNGKKGREWLGALQWALSHYDEDPSAQEEALLKTIKKSRAMRKIALKVVADAMEGKEAAWREIAERHDGKVSTNGDTPSLRVLVIRGLPDPQDNAPAPLDCEVVRVPLPSPDDDPRE